MNTWDKYLDIEFYKWTLKDIRQDEDAFVIGSYTEEDLTRKTHSHEFMQIYYICEGVLIHKVEDESGYLLKGDMFIIPPNVYHLIETGEDERVKFISIGFMPHFVDYWTDTTLLLNRFINFLLIDHTINTELKVKPRLTFSGQLQIKIIAIINDMLEEYTKKKEGYMFYIKGQLLRLLVLIAREYVSAPYYHNSKDIIQAYNKCMIQSIEYINKNFTKDLRIDDVASMFHISRTYFCELFKIYTGKTFNEYVNDLRIWNARILLSTSNISITDIAYKTGFNSTSNFYRRFAKAMGVSPSQYKKIQSS